MAHQCITLCAQVYDGAYRFWIQGDRLCCRVGWGASLSRHNHQAATAGREAESKGVASGMTGGTKKEWSAGG